MLESTRSGPWPSWLVVVLALVGPVVLTVAVAFGVSALMDLIPYPHTMQGGNDKDVDTKYAILLIMPVSLLTYGFIVWRRANETARVVFLLFAIPLSLMLEALMFMGSVAK
jgi:hypothetical protein